MGSWGTGIKQSDGFADVYETFFDYYNEGSNPVEITKQLFIDFSEILDIDEEKHEFWFALALAQWETKSLDNSVLSTVETIITSGADLKFWQESNIAERDINKRKIVLDKFLTQLKSSRPKPKSRKRQQIKVPVYKDGDCIIFKLKNGNYGGAVVIETNDHSQFGGNLIATTRINQKDMPTLSQFMETEILFCNHIYTGFPDRALIGWYGPDDYKNYKDIFNLIGNLNVEFTYDNSNRDGKGYLFDNSHGTTWNFPVIADIQFEFENKSPRSSKTVTLEQLIKKAF